MPWDALLGELTAALGEPITLDALTGSWRIAQRAAGHRHSVDDVLTVANATRGDARTNLAQEVGIVLGGKVVVKVGQLGLALWSSTHHLHASTCILAATHPGW